MHLIFLDRPAPLRSWVHLLIRRRRIWRQVFLHSLIRWTSGSDVHHVLSSDGEVAIDPHRSGDRYWPHEAVPYHPQLWKIVHVPDESRPPRVPGGLYDFDRVARSRRSWIRSLACWATFGLIRSEDCVQVARLMLADHGIRVPRRITTPIGLYRWLVRSTHETPQ